MNGYECPCCTALIFSNPQRPLPCPQCKASVTTQRLAAEYRGRHVRIALSDLERERGQ